MSVSVQEIKQTSSDQNTESSQLMKREPKSDLNSKQIPLPQLRQIISARQIQKLTKEDSPVFLAIVRKTNEALQKRGNKRFSNCAAKFVVAHGLTEVESGQ